MVEVTVPMAIVDFIPVALFFAAAVLLQRDLYPRLGKGPFALLASGSILVLIGGIYKAVWKLLYALSVCDFQALNTAMFPMQAPGFLLVFLGLTALQRDSVLPGPTGALAVAAPAVYDSNILFIAVQVIGYGGIQFCLARLAKAMKKPLAIVLFILAFVFILGMGYLGSAFDDSALMQWVAQGTNILSQGCFFLGVLILHRSGLKNEQAA
ncbi:MAG: hypothetical protein J5785_00760 [Spirochaetales bacterium]|nr:hypothetical protein [Spirochaetales bacterium]